MDDQRPAPAQRVRVLHSTRWPSLDLSATSTGARSYRLAAHDSGRRRRAPHAVATGRASREVEDIAVVQAGVEDRRRLDAHFGTWVVCTDAQARSRSWPATAPGGNCHASLTRPSGLSPRIPQLRPRARPSPKPARPPAARTQKKPRIHSTRSVVTDARPRARKAAPRASPRPRGPMSSPKPSASQGQAGVGARRQPRATPASPDPLPGRERRARPRARTKTPKPQARPTASVRKSGQSQERQLKNSDITPI